MQCIFDRALREAEALPGAEAEQDTLDDRRGVAAQDILYEILEMLEGRGMVRRVHMTLHAEAWPTYFKATLVGDAYRRRKERVGTVRVFVTIPRGGTAPDEPAVVRIEWALTLGGVWYTRTVRMRAPLERRQYRDVIPAIHAAQSTLDGSISLDDANHLFQKRKRHRNRDRAVMRGLRMV